MQISAWLERNLADFARLLPAMQQLPKNMAIPARPSPASDCKITLSEALSILKSII